MSNSQIQKYKYKKYKYKYKGHCSRGNWPPSGKVAGLWRADVFGGWSLGRLFLSPARVDCDVRGEPGGTFVPVNWAAGDGRAVGDYNWAVSSAD